MRCRNCDRLDVLVHKVPLQQRATAKMRVDQLKYDARHLATALQTYQLKRARIQQDLDDREQLLSRRFTSNDAAAAADGDSATVQIDFGLQHHTAMGGAHRGVDEMLATGQQVLGGLRSQRDTLKGAQRRLMDIGSTLGLSNHTMRLIERRIEEDRWLLFGGMAATTLLFGAVIWWVVL